MLISLGRWRDEGKERTEKGGTLAVNGSLSLSLPLSLLSVCWLYYSRLMGTGEIVLGVNGAENGVVLKGCWGGAVD